MPLVLYGDNPLALRYLGRLLHPARATVLPFSSDRTRSLGDHEHGFVLIADEGSHDSSKQKVFHLLRTIREHARILIIGHSASPLYLRHLIHAGVHGFISYEDLESQLKAALATVRIGRLWMPTKAAERGGQSAPAAPRADSSCGRALTAREQIVLQLLQRHLSNKEIGNHLGISERTVKFHLSNIFDKFSVRDRYAAVSVAQAFATSNPADNLNHPGPLAKAAGMRS